MIKGLGAERHFNIMVGGDNVSKAYRMINFRCTDSKYKKKERDLYMDKCTFYLQYIEEPDKPQVFKLHSYNSYHKHEFKKRHTLDMNDYYQKKKSTSHEYKDRLRNPKKDWK